MNLPTLIDNKLLASMAAPGETMAVRVIVRQVFNNKPYRLRGRLRHYLADHDPKLNVHVLDVPASVWMRDFPTGTYKENPSIAHDLQGNRIGAGMTPLLFAVVPWKKAGDVTQPVVMDTPVVGANEDGAKPLAALRKLSESLGAPEILVAAIDLAASPERTPSEIEAALLDTVANVDAEVRKAAVEAAPAPQQAAASGAKTNAQRQKEYRERKAAKKAAKNAPTKQAKKKH